ncbi:TPA: lipoprotein, partial [Escherichia coli]|nr:lipoprotein [Escherichia coli]
MKNTLLPLTLAFILSGCSNWVNGNKILADKNIT